MNISEKSSKLLDWSKDEFSFVASFYKTQIKSVSSETLVQTYEIDKSPEGKFIGFWAAEPKHSLHHFVKWETTQIKFHYPAEHPWTQVLKNGTNNTVYASMEMQIYGYVSD